MQIAGRYRSEDGKRAGRGGWWLPILGLLIHLCPRGRKKGTAASIDSSCWPLGRQAEREAIAEKSHSVLLLSPFSLGCCGCYSLSLPRRMARFCTTRKNKKKKKKNKSNAEERRRRNGRVICGRVVRSFNTGVGFPPIVADWPVGERGHGVGVGSD